MIRQLLSCFPSPKIDDPEGYFANLCSILTAYAEIDARAGIQAVANSSQWPPTRFEVRQACEKAAGDRCRLERLQSIPAPQLEKPYNRPRMPADAPLPEGATQHTPGTILTNCDEAYRLYGRPVGAFEDGRWHLYNSDHVPI